MRKPFAWLWLVIAEHCLLVEDDPWAYPHIIHS